MFNNVKAKKRLTQLIVAFVVICMSVTGSFLLLDDAIDAADAATYNAQVGSITDWHSAVNGKKSGDIINITLKNSFNASQLTAIPAGVTVNLDMAGSTISFDNATTGVESIPDNTFLTKSYPAKTTYLGAIVNHGTLTITGEGTIRANQSLQGEQKADTTNLIGRVAAIANYSGATLNIADGINVQSYATYFLPHWSSSSGDGYADAYVYSYGIYNEGTVNTAANIYASAFTHGYSAGTDSLHYAFAYGIFGGTVNVSGGSVKADAYSGSGRVKTTGYTNEDQVCNYAVGVCSNKAVIKGDTNIVTNSISWRSTEKRNNWKSGANISWSVGVLYTGSNYPVVGASVDIKSTFTLASDGNQFTAPGTSYTTEGVVIGDDIGTAARYAYAVAGVNGTWANMAGTQTSEAKYGSIFGSATSNKYLAEEPYEALGSAAFTDAYLADTSSVNQSSSSESGGDTKTATFTNGAAGSAGAQFKIIYRYFNSTFNKNNLSSVATKADNRLKNKAVVAVGGNNNERGVILDNSQGVRLVDETGVPQNDRYHKFEGATYSKIKSATFANRKYTEMGDWIDGMGSTSSFGINSDVKVGGDETLIIYMNYIIKDPSAIKIVASDSEIADDTATTAFTAAYTGSPLVPGKDFQLGIIDLGADKNAETNKVSDDKAVTDVYDISGNGTTSGNNATAVRYRYTSDNTNWTAGLPKDAGEYIIEVEVFADVTYAVSGTYNRQAKTSTISATITKATPAITGSDSLVGTYGDPLSKLVPTDSYTLKGLGSDVLEGTWTYTGREASSYPEVGEHEINLLWTPKAGTKTAQNYKPVTYTVTLNVNKRNVTVNAGSSTVTYGDKSITNNLTFEGLAECDAAKSAGWKTSTVIEVNYKDNWVAYSQGIPAGTYKARVKTFGGAEDANNNFTIVDSSCQLVVEKRSIYYNAAATDRAYNGSDEVSVKLSYVSGCLDSDSRDATIDGVIGKMENANAGQNKKVTVDEAAVNIKNGENYKLAIYNKDTIVVTISKADPTGVSVKADPEEITYNADTTLADIKLKETNAIDGSWSWQNAEINPTVDVASYKAVFTPADTTNYNTLEQNVLLRVNQKQVFVTVKDFTIAYGDAVPALQSALQYDGLGSDTIGSIGLNGSIDVTTTYTKGSPVGEYDVNITSSLSSTNYYFTPVNNKIVVGPKTLTVTVLDQSVTYGAVAPEYDVTDLKFEGFYGTENYTSLEGTLKITTTYEYGKDAGSYDIEASGYSSANYDIKYVKGILTVDKAVLTVIPSNVTGVTYGADAPAYADHGYYTYSGFVAGDDAQKAGITGKPAFSTSYASGQNAGTYPVTVTVNNLEAKNYTFAGSEGSLIVGKATPSFEADPIGSVVNSHKYSTATFSYAGKVINPNKAAMTVDGKLSLQDSEKVAVYTDGSIVEAVVVFTPYDTINYNSTSKTVYIEIEEKTISGKPVIQGSAMAGKTLTLNLDAMDPASVEFYTIQWFADGNAIAGATGTTYTIASGDADLGKKFTVTLYAKTEDGFIGEATSDPTSAVIKALLETTAAQFKDVNVSVEYDTFSHEVDVDFADGYADERFGDVTVKYNGVTTAPTKAGKYTITVDVTAPKVDASEYVPDYHYGPATGIVVGELNITRAPYTVSVLVTDKIYDGTDIAYATVTGSGLKDEANEVVYVAPGCQFAFADAKVGENKTVTVTSMELAGKDADNYYIVEDVSTASITPRTLTVRVTATPKIYDGSALVNVTFSNIEGYASTDGSSSVYLTNGTAEAVSADAGEWNITKVKSTLAGSKAENYVVVYSNANTAKVVISPATPNVSAPEIHGITYNAGITLENLNIYLTPYATEDGFWQFNNASTVPTVKQKTYSATYYSTNKNYTNVVTDITVHVEPLAVTLYPVETTVTYGTKAPVIKVGPEYLPDGTPLADIGGSCTAVHGYAPGSPVGRYEVQLNNALSDDNYTFTTSTGNLTAIPAVINVTATAVNRVYNGTTDITVEFDKNLAGKYGNDDVSLSTFSTTGQAASPNAGTTTVTYTKPVLVGEDYKNYDLNVTPTSGDLTVIIAKADVAGVIFPVDGQVEFGYDLRYATFMIDGVGDGKFAFENAKDIIPSELGYYEYKVIFTPTDSRNYNTQEAMVSLEVVKCQLNYVVGIAGTTQVGQTLVAVTTGLPAVAADYIQYQWYRTDGNKITAINGATSDRYVATEADIGYTLVVYTYFDSATPYVFHENANTDSFDNGVSFGITGQSKESIKEVTLSFWQRLMDWIYRIIAVITGVKLGGVLG